MHFFKKKAVSTVTPVVIFDKTNENIQQEHGSRPLSARSRLSHHAINVPVSEHVILPENGNCCQQCCTKSNLKEQALLIATVVAVLLGIAVGVALRGLKCPAGILTESFHSVIYVHL